MSEFGEWDGQSPPTARTYRGKDVITLQSVVDKSLPNFGPYAKEKRSLIAEENGRVSDLLGDNKVQANRPAAAPDAKVPTVQEVIGRALDSIGTYNDLDNRLVCNVVIDTTLVNPLFKSFRQHVVALIDPEMCINCGKCYMTCNDTGYQAIQFDPETHLPKVTLTSGRKKSVISR